MPSGHTFLVFSAAALALLIVPGPSVFYLVTQSIGSGRRGGVAAMLGIQAAGLVHVVAAAVGVSAVLMSSAIAFNVVKYTGAAYLVLLGIQRLRSGESFGELCEGALRQPSRRLLRQGFVVNLFNPKSALFFLAVLPQFVDPARGSAWLQVLVLGGTFLALAVVTDSAWVTASASLARRLRTARARRVERHASAAILIGLGVAAALQDH